MEEEKQKGSIVHSIYIYIYTQMYFFIRSIYILLITNDTTTSNIIIIITDTIDDENEQFKPNIIVNS